MFWSQKLKVTKQRRALVEVIFNEKQPITIGTLKEKLNISLASIYRNLNTLIDAGIVHRINTNSAEGLYELISDRKHHHHLICSECGDIEELENKEKCPASKLTEYILDNSKKFSAINSHSLEFFGLCKKCA